MCVYHVYVVPKEARRTGGWIPWACCFRSEVVEVGLDRLIKFSKQGVPGPMQRQLEGCIT